MISRDHAEKLVRDNISSERMLSHIFSVEAVMRDLARRIREDEEIWGLTGLLHDLDVELTETEPERHAYHTCEMLEGQLPQEALDAIIVHPGHKPPRTTIDKGLMCSDPVTGLITAAVYTHPSKSLQDLPLKSVKKRYKDKRFAAGASREQIAMCKKIGVPLGDFLELSLVAMGGISEKLGL